MCVLYHTPHTQLRQLPWYGHIQLQVLLFRFHGFIFFPLSRSLFSLFFVCPFFLLFSFFFPQGIPLLFWAWRLFIYFRWSATPTGLYEREEFASCYCFTSPSLVPPSSFISAAAPPLLVALGDFVVFGNLLFQMFGAHSKTVCPAPGQSMFPTRKLVSHVISHC